MDVTEPLRGFARTSIGIGIGNVVVGGVISACAFFRLFDRSDDTTPIWAVWLAAAFVVPGVAMIVIGYRLYAGRFWAAIALLSIAVFEVPKLLVIVLPLVGTGRGWMFALIPMSLIVRCMIVLPEIRFQVRARRRAAAARGFEPIIAPAAGRAGGTVNPLPTTPQPPPRRLKPDVRARTAPGGRGADRG